MLEHMHSFVKTAIFCLQAIAFLHLKEKEQKGYWTEESLLPILFFQVCLVHAIHCAANLKVIAC